MSKDMLGAVVRAAIGVPQESLGTLAKIASKLARDQHERLWCDHYLSELLKRGFGNVELPNLKPQTIHLAEIVVDYDIDWRDEVAKLPARAAQVRDGFSSPQRSGRQRYHVWGTSFNRMVGGHFVHHYLHEGGFTRMTIREGVALLLAGADKVGEKVLPFLGSAFATGDGERLKVPAIYRGVLDTLWVKVERSGGKDSPLSSGTNTMWDENCMFPHLEALGTS